MKAWKRWQRNKWPRGQTQTEKWCNAGLTQPGDRLQITMKKVYHAVNT